MSEFSFANKIGRSRIWPKIGPSRNWPKAKKKLAVVEKKSRPRSPAGGADPPRSMVESIFTASLSCCAGLEACVPSSKDQLRRSCRPPLEFSARTVSTRKPPTKPSAWLRTRPNCHRSRARRSSNGLRSAFSEPKMGSRAEKPFTTRRLGKGTNQFVSLGRRGHGRSVEVVLFDRRTGSRRPANAPHESEPCFVKTPAFGRRHLHTDTDFYWMDTDTHATHHNTPQHKAWPALAWPK